MKTNVFYATIAAVFLIGCGGDGTGNSGSSSSVQGSDIGDSGAIKSSAAQIVSKSEANAKEEPVINEDGPVINLQGH